MTVPNLKCRVVPVCAMKACGGSGGISTMHFNWGARWRWVVRFLPQRQWQPVDRQKFRIILPFCTLDIAPPPPAAKVSGDTNVNISDIAPWLAAVKECGSVGWDFCLVRQHGSVSAVHPKIFIFTLQKSPFDYSNSLLCAPSHCTFKQPLTSQQQLPVASHHTFQVISHTLFRQLCGSFKQQQSIQRWHHGCSITFRRT
jgi:hypothetical protein